MPLKNFISKYDWQYLVSASVLISFFIFTDLIKDAMKKRILATERLHDDYRKMFKNKEHPTIVNGYV